MVLVYKLDRLSRSQKDVLYLVEDVFDKHGIYFSSMTENFDTSTPFGKAILGILAVFAQLEREQIRERTMMGKQARAEEGKWGGGSTVPTGYDYVNGELVINEFEAMQIKEIAKMFLDNVPLRRIATICDEKGYVTKHGEWDAKGIRRVLSNKLYLGYMKYHNKYYKGTHTPILDQETHDKIMLLMNARAEQYGTSYKPYTTLLGGILYCKHCGGKYAKRPNTNGTLWYSCYSRNKSMKKMIKDPNCKNKNYKVIELDAEIISCITQLSIDPAFVEQIRHEKPKNNVEDKRKTISAEIEKILSQISNMMNLYSLNKMPIELIDKEISTLNNKRVALEKELDSLKAPEIDEDEMTIEQIQSLANLINDENLTLEDKRNIVQSLIYYIEIDNEDVIIHWKF
jgi:site-specific DNA recombinase